MVEGYLKWMPHAEVKFHPLQSLKGSACGWSHRRIRHEAPPARVACDCDAGCLVIPRPGNQFVWQAAPCPEAGAFCNSKLPEAVQDQLEAGSQHSSRLAPANPRVILLLTLHFWQQLLISKRLQTRICFPLLAEVCCSW